MQLVIDSYGAFLGVQDGMFMVRTRQQGVHQFAARKVSSISLTKGVTVSTDALVLAIENEINVMLTDGLGRPMGQVWHGRFGSISTIRKNQTVFAAHPEGMRWIRDVLMEKLANQQIHLRALQKSRPELEPAFRRGLRILHVLENQFRQIVPAKAPEPERLAASFRGWEGSSTKYYFRSLSAALPPSFQFSERTRRPSRDRFNCLLNYAYGILYGMVEASLIRAGVDPHVGVLHADQYNRPVLAYDFIEPFRIWAETVVVQLCLRGQVDDACFGSVNGGIWLTKEGRSIVVNAFGEYLEELVVYKGRSRRRSSHIDVSARQFAQMMLAFER